MAKNKRLTKADGRAWPRHWRLVNQHEQAELRQTSIETELQQLAALIFKRPIGFYSSTGFRRACT
jgi:hypothetical protein